jgi:hypothetical protein
MWVEDAEDVGNHTAATVDWTEGTFVVDTTIQQFGGDADLFIGTLDQWQARILALQTQHAVTHPIRQEMNAPLGDNAMAMAAQQHGAPYTGPAREARRQAERLASARAAVARAQAAKAARGPDPDAPKKGCCFLTTACVEYRGLPDDCRELTTLRAFRDGYLSAQPDGPALIAEYYRLAPALVVAIGQSAHAADVLEEIYAEITLCVADIDGDDPASALCRYRKMVEGLLARFALA